MNGSTSLERKVVIVTGASRGIGKAVAVEMARQGAKVVVAARTEEAAKIPGTIHETLAEIKALGGEAIAIRADVGDENSVNNMVRQTIEAYGRIDVLINNAAVSPKSGPFVESKTRYWELVLRVCLTGPFFCCRAALPYMIERKSGSIVNLSSTAGEMDGPRHLIVDPAIGPENTDQPPAHIAYAASKAGLERFSNALAHEMREHNIAVNVVKPRVAILTEGMRLLFPNEDWSRWRKPEDYMVKGILFLATRDSSLTGQVFYDDEVCQRFGL